MDNFTDSLTQEQPLSKKILRNTLYNTAGTGCLILVSLILTPYILSYIGIERFGIWAIVNVLIAYFGFFDFSLDTPVIKYASEYYVTRDFSKLNQLFNTAFIFYLGLGALTGITGFAFSNSILDLFNISANLYQEALFSVRMGIISFAFLCVFSVFSSFLFGLQYMDITNKILIFSSIINIIGTVFVLKSGYGLQGLILNYLIVILVRGIIGAVAVFRKLSFLKFNPFRFQKTMFKNLLGFGVKLHIAKLAFLVNFQMDKLLLARFLSLASVTFYDLGSKIAFTIRRLAFLLASAIVPAASEIDVTRGRASLYSFYLRVSKYVILASAPLFLFAIFNAKLILMAWLGEGFSESILVIQILGIGYFATVITAVLSNIASGMGRPEFEMKRSLLAVPLNLALSIILIIKIGLIGACIGTAVSFIVGCLLLLKLFHNYLGKPPKDLTSLLWRPISASVAAGLLVMPVDRLVYLLMPFSLRINSVLILLIKGIIHCTAYFIIITAFGCFDREDIELSRKRIPVINKLLLLTLAFVDRKKKYIQ